MIKQRTLPHQLSKVEYRIENLAAIANKLKPFLSSIISVNQSAFVPKRLITDNATVAFEIFHVMKRKEGKNETIALKLDTSKTYDRIEWSFLERVA